MNQEPSISCAPWRAETDLEEVRVVYFQCNEVRDDPVESLADFSERVFRFIADNAVDKLVIDLRWNGGGNLFLEMPMVHRLIGSKVNQRGRLFVIIGRATFSAAQYGASLIDGHTEAIFVGEPTGSSPTFIGESVGFELPHSKTCANVSDLLWQGTWAMDYRIWIAPTLYTPPTFAAFRENRDYLGDGIWELRISLGRQQLRILYTVVGGVAILLEGFVKKTQQTPKSKIALAKKRRRQIP